MLVVKMKVGRGQNQLMERTIVHTWRKSFAKAIKSKLL